MSPFVKSNDNKKVVKMMIESFRGDRARLMARVFSIHVCQSVLQGIHAQSDIHPRAVGEEGSQSSLHQQAKDQDSVPVQQKRDFNEKYCQKR